jgi:hypothetical protein
VLIADGATGNIVRIPYVSGALNTAGATTVETLPSFASSLWADAAGDLFVASGSAKSAYAIQRTAVSINLGTVADGADNTGTIYLINAGNETATLGTPNLTQPTNTMFTLAPAATDGCAAGAPEPAGVLCAITAEFAPPAGSSDAGAYGGSGAIALSTPALSIPVTLSGTASVSAISPASRSLFRPRPLQDLQLPSHRPRPPFVPSLGPPPPSSQLAVAPSTLIKRAVRTTASCGALRRR